MLPDQSRGRPLAADLVDRGHRRVRLRPVYLPHLDPADPFFSKPEFSRPDSYSAAIAVTPVRLTGIPGPAAPTTAAGLHILHLMLESEADA